MAFPPGWPPSAASGRRSIRAYISGTGTTDFADNAYLFQGLTSANPSLPPAEVHYGTSTTVDYPAAVSNNGDIWSGNIKIYNNGANDLEFSFDGTHVHGVLKTTEVLEYRQRYEAGIALRGNLVAFKVEAW